ncbi:interferon-induced very large GTPase 1-like isoform X2 [Mugil cephalus]|uniref:interferon-induced very large GTPase 1-like isoform X2 n=1 Tax=Mugil cephalus TaxID=48193 RepID=UPI001FB5E9FA|nr:interferon-induced very large GTPase 1-like isoform X2 [Mugil cephalus]
MGSCSYLYFTLIYQKEISDEDFLVNLSHEEVEDLPAACSVCEDDHQQTDTGEPVPPASVTVSSISSESVSLQWDTPAGEVESYNVTCCSEGETVQELNTDTNSVTFNNLRPGVCYSLHVCALLKNARRSSPTETSATTNVPPPVEATVLHAGVDTVSLGLASSGSSVRYKLHVDYTCKTQGGSVDLEDCSPVDVVGLNPGTEYTFRITRIAENGNQSTVTSISACTEPVPPASVTVSSISSESVSLQWDTPAGEVESYNVTCCSEGETVQELKIDTNSVTFNSLRPGVCYYLHVCAQLKNGRRSRPTKTSATTERSCLNEENESALTVEGPSSEDSAVDFFYEAPDDLPSTSSAGKDDCEQADTSGNSLLMILQRVQKVWTGPLMESASHKADVPPPVEATVLHAGVDTVSLGLASSGSSVRYKLHVDYTCKTQGGSVDLEDCSPLDVVGLNPGTEYTFRITRIAENGNQSTVTSISACTEPVPPASVTVSSISSESVSLQWDTPAGEVESYNVTCCSEGETVQELNTDTNSVTINSLRPGVCYSLHVCAQLGNGRRSRPTETSATTETYLKSRLVSLGLEQYYRQKLSLSQILQIDETTINDEQPAMSKSDLPWYFLKKLLMVNVSARNVNYKSGCESNCEAASEITEFDFPNLLGSANTADMLNPLDLITALFLCSDGFVQQEMTLKMSMCQFSVPLLLPNSDTQQCTLMLWAMRDIVKKYRPQSLLDSKGFIEERIVLSELPMVSFVRLGECTLSKSEILNKLLSNSQQYHDTFVHHNMEGGDSPRRISNGLTEITWYLPGGNKNMDIFSEPVAVANLRGDIASFETQFSFLCHTSAAVFVFFDNLDSGCNLLTNRTGKAQIFLVGNHNGKNFSLEAVRKVATQLGLTNNNIIIKTKQKNDADFVRSLRKAVSDVVENSKMKLQIEQMADIAHEFGILVDEDVPECKSGKNNADAITEEIQDALKYKEEQLPLQGDIWKELTCLEKEEFRLRNAGSKNIEEYKGDLQMQKRELRQKQNSYDMSNAMTCFINAISSSGTERRYFLKWMRMNLDNVSREKLSGLRERYKEKCKNSDNKEEIKKIDKQLSNSSLGTEHFFREMGQIYEASLSLPETDPSRQQLQHLPKLCAELLLDGFPLELVDGDASNIPLRWVSGVLSQLNVLVSSKNKIRVITVLGVQSTGKSTLLNTMFGVQFAVSSGRCTRGAFMLLIRINEDAKKLLNCDFMVIIDTEGLKSPELAQLDNSYEHDNELATLVVGLSDVTIINIAMENSSEMKDILQIVVHAFLRMKEVGKKPKCQFVHQNVSDVSAHEKNLRDRKLLLQQLNEMTQAAAKMERKEENKSFTDVMEYCPDTGNWYIPGLWNGNPPMAPVNAGYSEAVYELKKNIIKLLGDCQSSTNNIDEFEKWVKSLWNAVKHENFIFSFRNSLVADAYMKLCSEYNKWEWGCKKEMYTWVTNAATRIANFGTVADNSQVSNMKDFLTSLKTEASTELSTWEKKLHDNLSEYFKQTEGHVYLVEGYKEDFSNSIKSFRREMERSVVDQLTAAADIKTGMTKLAGIKKNHTKEIETAVHALIDECRKKKVQMRDTELEKRFDKMWKETLEKLSFTEQKATDVFASAAHCLRSNLSHKGGHASELLSQKNLRECGLEPFKYTAEGLLNQWKHAVRELLGLKDHIKVVQNMADKIIDACTLSVDEKLKRRTNYHDTYIEEILHIIDESLKNKPDVKIDMEFEVSLKQHICGSAARKFQKMEEDFIQVNDPYRCLMKNKEKFCADFKDVFHKRDQCQKKAQEFTDQCLKPAVEVFVNRSLGPNIIDEMLKQEQFSTRMSFQYSLLLDLLEKDRVEDYFRYNSSYESFIKTRILEQIEERFSSCSVTLEFEERHLQSSISSINDAIKKAKAGKSGDMKTFVERICKELGDKLVISQDALGAFMILNNANREQFADCLTVSVKDMAEALREKFKESNIKIKLQDLHVQPQNELFTRVIGCGKQCPFCGAPCEAGGKDHEKHFTSLHRPQGLGRYRCNESKKLVTDICSSSVTSENNFYSFATMFQWHPFKRYHEIFPSWDIRPDVSLQASDYWKYVMTRYNKEFAKEYEAEPADIPSSWKKISYNQAEQSLKDSFSIN